MSRRLLVAAALAAGLVVLLTSPAGAHAHLESHVPSSGQKLGAGRTVILTFDDPVETSGSTISIQSADGTVTGLDLRHPGGELHVLAGRVPDGIFGSLSVSWTVLALDGHLSTGSFPVDGSRVAPVRPTDTSGVAGALTLARMLSLLALVVLCGGLAFVGGVWPEGAVVRRAHVLLWSAWALGAVSTVAGIGLLGASTRRLGLGDAAHLAVIRTVLATHVGHAWAARLLLYGLAVAVLWTLSLQGSTASRSTAWRLGAAAVALGLVRTPGLAGHASELAHARIGTVADWAHVAGASVWLGGLAMLCIVVLPRRDADELARVVPRFSNVAVRAVGTIVLGGAVLAWQLVGGLHALLATRYGHLLLIKSGVFAAALLAARQSKRWTDRRLAVSVADGDVVAIGPFVRSVVTEAVLAVGVLAAAALLISTSPSH